MELRYPDPAIHSLRLKTLRKYKRRLVAILVSLVILMAGGLWAIMYFFGDEVKQSLLGRLNDRLQIEISVEEIHLDLFSSFPYASMRFKHIESKEKGSTTGNNMLKAGEIALLFDIRDIFVGHYEIERMHLHNAFLNLLVRDDGSVNYRIIKNEGAGDSDVQINLKKVDFKNVVVSFIHSRSQQEYLFRINSGSLNGAFSNQTQLFKFDGDLYSNHIKSGLNTFLKARELTLQTTLSIDRDNQRIEFRATQIRTAGIKFLVEGLVGTHSNNNLLDLNIGVEHSSIQSLLKLIPPAYLNPFKEINLKGTASINAQVTGNFSGNKIPKIDVQFELDKGHASYTPTNFQFDDLRLKGTFSNGAAASEKTFRLHIADFKSRFDGGTLEGALEITDFRSPNIQTRILGLLDLSTLTSYYPIDTLQYLSGQMEVNLQFKNQLKSFRSFTIQDFISSKTTGKLEIRDVDAQLHGSPHTFNSIEGLFQFNNKDLIIDRFAGLVSDNDFSMKGTFKNILAFAFRPNESIFIDAEFVSKNLNLDQLLVSGSDESSEKMRLRVSERVNFNINFAIDTFTFKKFRSTKNSGRLILKNRILHVHNAKIHSMDGIVDLEGSIDATMENLYFIRCSADFEQVNIHKLFHDFGNFGQQNLTSENLKGLMDAQVEYTSTLTPNLFVDQRSVYTLADIRIENGELIRYQPLQKLSKYVKEGEFEYVQFSTLENQIRIDNEVVYIPQMDIESNRMNLKLSGNHRFNNTIDYHLQLLLSDIIARNEAIEEDLGDNFVVDDGLGRTTLYLSLSGEANNPVIKYDTREVRNKLAEDLKKEKQEFREVLRKEFAKEDKDPGGSKSGDIPETGTGESFKIDFEETRQKQQDPKHAPKVNAAPAKSSNQKDFIIEWEEEEDTIKQTPGNIKR